MNYIKIFNGRAYEVQEEANAFLKEVQAHGHRVYDTRICEQTPNRLFLTLTLNDEPHPHNKK